MRVLYVVTAYDRHPGDVITPWLVETIGRLRREGVDVEVLAPSYRGLDTQVVEGVRVHRFRYAPRSLEDLTHDETAPDRVRHRPWYLALVPGYLISGTYLARRLAGAGDFDVVHVHWPVPHVLQGVAARRAGGQPLVCSFHGVELTLARQLPVLRPLVRFAVRTADAVTANSTYTARMMREIHDRSVELIPFGASVGRSVLAESDRSAADPDRSGPFRLLFVGRLVERKGVRHLLDAVAEVPVSRDVRLRVVGDGPLRQTLEARARELGIPDRVEFEGFIGREELARRYRECDAFVLPAVIDSKGDTEGLGVVLIEALSYERPVIASEVGGIPDIVRHQETGLLVPPSDPRALVRAITEYADRPEYARRLARAGRDLVEREYSWPVIVRRLTALYERLAR